MALSAGFGLDFTPERCDPELFEAMKVVLEERDIEIKQAEARAGRP